MNSLSGGGGGPHQYSFMGPRIPSNGSGDQDHSDGMEGTSFMAEGITVAAVNISPVH